MPFRTVDVAGDGSCFFRAVANTVIDDRGGVVVPAPTSEQTRVASMLRKWVVLWLKRNLDLIDRASSLRMRALIELRMRDIGCATVSAYLREMDNNAHADYPEIVAASEVLNRCIVLYDSKVHGGRTPVCTVVPGLQRRVANAVYVLRDGMHFKTLLQ